ncbi:hypothetical protein OROGR_013095 [Orobanche gracilis]
MSDEHREEQYLLEGLNSFRSANTPALVKHDQADLVVDDITDKSEENSRHAVAADLGLLGGAEEVQGGPEHDDE